MAKTIKDAGANKAPATPETLEAALELIATQNEVIAELSSENEKLSALVVAGKKAGVIPVTIEIDGGTYVINHGSRIGTTIYSKEDLAENEKVCKQILEMEGQATLTLKVEEQ
jgi:hypothetical protein